jgi:hypothetical protein
MRPVKWTGMIALVAGEIAASSLPGSMFWSGCGRRHKRIRRRDHFIARTHPQRQQSKHQRVGAAVERDAMLGLAQQRRLSLKLFHLSAADILARCQNLLDDGKQFIALKLPLSRKIYVGDFLHLARLTGVEAGDRVDDVVYFFGR